MLVSIVAVVMAAAAFALVGYPLLRERRQPAIPPLPDDYQRLLEDLLAQRQATYAAIKELDFDHEMGNLADADYHELRERYRRKAAGILRDLDELQAGSVPFAAEAGPDGEEEPATSLDDELEREIRRRRRARRRAASGGRTCTSCGGPIGPRDRFCAGCGMPVVAGCPHCGSAFQPEDRFCGRCGAALVVGVAQ